jgi:hypothetical protein
LNFLNPGTIVVVIGLLGVFYCGLFPEPILRFAQSIPAIVGLAGN